MSKQGNAVAIRKEASVAASAFARLEAATEKSLKHSNGERTFQMIAANNKVSALIKAPGLTVQFQDGQFAVDIGGQNKE